MLLAGPVRASLSIDEEQRDAARTGAGPPPAPKRRRVNSSRADRLAGFAVAARLPNQSSAATLISSAYRGHRARAFVATTRPGTASSSASDKSSLDDDEVPEEIETEEDYQCRSQLEDLSIMAAAMQNSSVDSALETSADLESSGESFDFHDDRTCAVCLGPMPHRRHRTEGSEASPAAGLAVVTLECSHKFHRKCLLGWCQQRPPGGCPLCREQVCVRRRRPAVHVAGSSSIATPTG